MSASSRRILVADDDPMILRALEHALTGEGYEVYLAADGDEALQTARQVQPDLVILDVMLPQVDGLEVCARLRSVSSVPILILSARGKEQDKIVGFKVGADDYVTKPFSLPELLLRVRAILRRASPSPADAGVEALRFRDIEINRGTRSVTVRGRRVDLTPKEFDLLWLLASHPGHVFSREAILQRVWHSDYTGDEAALTVCVRRLRAKVEPNPGQPEYIKTVWGVGYKFEP
ncbi:MAG TPA: response regulator transcription factor [Symbiobacteriaceae bacterium]